MQDDQDTSTPREPTYVVGRRPVNWSASGDAATEQTLNYYWHYWRMILSGQTTATLSDYELALVEGRIPEIIKVPPLNIICWDEPPFVIDHEPKKSLEGRQCSLCCGSGRQSGRSCHNCKGKGYITKPVGKEYKQHAATAAKGTRSKNR